MGPQPAREPAPRRPHHLEVVADAFLSRPSPRAAPRRTFVVAGQGVGDTAPVAAALAGLEQNSLLRDLGDAVGVRLPRWEREGLQMGGQPGAAPVLVWCVTGADATSLVSGLTLGRLAALLEPVAATVVWLPDGHRPTGAPPGRRFQALARRLITTAVPRARVGLHCLGWQRDLATDLQSLAMRFA